MLGFSRKLHCQEHFDGGFYTRQTCIVSGECSRKLLTRCRDFRKSLKMRKMNHFSLFCKSCLVVFLTILTALWFYAVPAQTWDFINCKIGIFWYCYWDFWFCICEIPEYKLQSQCSIVTITWNNPAYLCAIFTKMYKLLVSVRWKR